MPRLAQIIFPWASATDMRHLYEKIMGHPWVYDKLRPLLMGGFDFREPVEWLETKPGETVVDVGCGTGHALNYLPDEIHYHGFDTDRRALESLKVKHQSENIQVYARPFDEDDLKQLEPDRVLLLGLLHHLTDQQASSLLRVLAKGRGLTKLVTEDPYYIRGRCPNNLLARLDRGKYVRSEKGYRRLVESAGWNVESCFYCPSGNKLATYLCMGLVPKEGLQ